MVDKKLTQDTVDEDLIPKKGNFRVVEIDISYADGFLGDPDDCCEVIQDFKFFWLARYTAVSSWISLNTGFEDDNFISRLKDFLRRPFSVSRPGGRFARQIHNREGKCVFYYQPYPPRFNLFFLCFYFFAKNKKD